MTVDPFIEAEEVAGHSVKQRLLPARGLPVPPTTSARRAIPSARARHRRRADRARSPPSTPSPSGTYGSPRVHQELCAIGVSPAASAGCAGSCARPVWRAAARSGGARPPSPIPTPSRPVTSSSATSGRGRDRPPLRRRHHLHRHLGGVGLPGHGHRPGRPAGWSGWALADHMRTELVSDALTMAFRQPQHRRRA